VGLRLFGNEAMKRDSFIASPIKHGNLFMQINTHPSNGIKAAEIVSNEIILTTIEDSLDLLGNLYYQGFDKIIIYEKNITPDFFDLKTRIAGDILQKFVQYRMPLIIVGDFGKFNSKSLNDFIFESNKGKQINFVSDLSEAMQLLLQ
jgi:hypothetical protein